ncbi:MAG: endonuclease MutS2, partial [Clostridiales Family XIII bacterium]|nr:endonuclease MutS2 [Clostridiales Family XIII bacterium]
MDVLKILEFDKIAGMLAARTTSALGAAAALSLAPSSVFETVLERQRETEQAVAVIMRKGSLPLGEFGDIADMARYADKGGVLSMSQLLAVAKHLGIARRASAFLRSDVRDVPILTDIAVAIEADKALESRIESSIVSETEMADAASPELRRIRRNIALQNEAIRARLNKMITSPTYAGMLREQLVTQRGSRWVVPV